MVSSPGIKIFPRVGRWKERTNFKLGSFSTCDYRRMRTARPLSRSNSKQLMTASKNQAVEAVPSRPNKLSTKNQPEVQFHKAEGLIQRDDIETLRVVLEENPSLKNVRDLFGHTLVWIAAREGKLRCLSVLAGSSADVDIPIYKTGATPLFVAAQNGHSACIRLLAELKANVNARLTETGATPMYAAAFFGKIDCITCLAELNADINVPTLEGRTPFFAAARQGHYDCIVRLVELRADINFAANDGWTPLMKSVHVNGDLKVITFLLQCGADVNLRNQEGKTALQLAKDAKLYIVAKELEKKISRACSLRLSKTLDEPKSKLPPPVPRAPQADSFEHEEPRQSAETETPIRKLPPVPRAPQADSFEAQIANHLFVRTQRTLPVVQSTTETCKGDSVCAAELVLESISSEQENLPALPANDQVQDSVASRTIDSNRLEYETIARHYKDLQQLSWNDFQVMSPRELEDFFEENNSGNFEKLKTLDKPKLRRLLSQCNTPHLAKPTLETVMDEMKQLNESIKLVRSDIGNVTRSMPALVGVGIDLYDQEKRLQVPLSDP